MKLNIAICDDNCIALNDEYNMICSVLDENKIEYVYYRENVVYMYRQ